MDNIILIGFMGVGKTEVGKLLAKSLGFTYIDTDSLIEKEQKRTINDIFAKEGEFAFRDMETTLLKKIKNSKKHVISTGGGMILRPENIKLMKALGPVILLWAEPKVIYDRIKNAVDRPLLNVPDPLVKIIEILGLREPIYKGAADLEIDTSGLSPEEACTKIIEYTKKGQN
jgi:shikimate kinase